MGVRAGAGLSTTDDPQAAAHEAAVAAGDALDGRPADLVLTFSCGSHLTDCDATLAGARDVLDPGTLIGCGAAGVVAGPREIEHGTATSVWAASLGSGSVEPFHATAREEGDGVAVEGLPELAGASGALILADPYSFPTDQVLSWLADDAPGVPVVGGVASARQLDGDAALLLDDEVVEQGAVGVRLDGVELLPCVSQGAAPIGPELTITAADGHVIHELAGAPALDKLREVVTTLDVREQALVSSGLMLGIVIDGDRPEYVRGDFLVRGLLGADPDAGSITVGAGVREGQVVRLHVRDGDSAGADLRSVLGLGSTALGGQPPAGALVFTCNGRGTNMFGIPDHDAATIQEQLGGVPAAGFFAAGEIGPVGGESFLHGFTATVALFPG